jgi:hypothetical protein
LKKDEAETTPTFKGVSDDADLPPAQQIVETSRFKRPLMQKDVENVETTAAEEEVKGVWNIKPGPDDQTKAPAEKVPVYKVPVKKATPAPAPVAPAAQPVPVAPKVKVTPPVIDLPAPATPVLKATVAPESAPAVVLPKPVVKKAPPPVNVPEPVKTVPPNTIPKVRPSLPAPPVAAPPRTPKIAEAIKPTPVEKLSDNPAVKLVSPELPKPAPVAPPKALRQQSGQRLILNSGSETKTPAAWGKDGAPADDQDDAPKVGDKLPGKDDTSQTKTSGWRGLFGSLR